MPNIAIIIVNWNVRRLLANCLLSVQADLQRCRLNGEIWVVDNNSTDGSAAMVRHHFPGVRLIAGEDNLGFAAGNNAALRAIGFGANGAADSLPELVLLLNPDTLVQPGALGQLVAFMQQTPQAGIVGARLVYGDGSFQHGAFDFPGLGQLAIELLPLPGRLAESKLNGRYAKELWAGQRPFVIGHPLGAAMGVRREAIEQVGLLDEKYHMYVEEIDWSRRITAAGWRAYCVPTAIVTHFGGQSTGQIQTASFINLWRSRYRFYKKYYGPLKVWLARQIVIWGMWRKIRQDAGAAGRGDYTTALAKRLATYQHVINIWQENSE